MGYERKDEEYEIMPLSEIKEMKKEIKSLKDKSPDEKLAPSIEKLNDNIKDLLSIFKETTKEIREEIEKEDLVLKKVNDIDSNVNELYEQNAKIAEAMISVHDTVKEMKKVFEEKYEKAVPMPDIEPRGAPPMPPLSPLPPPGRAPQPPRVPVGLGHHDIGPIPTIPPARRRAPPIPPTPGEPKKEKKFFI